MVSFNLNPVHFFDFEITCWGGITFLEKFWHDVNQRISLSHKYWKIFFFTWYLKIKCLLMYFFTNHCIKNYFIRGSSLEILKKINMNLIPISEKLFLVKQKWSNLIMQPFKSDLITSVLRDLLIRASSSTHLHDILWVKYPL